MVTSARQPHDNQQECHNDVVRGKPDQKAGKGRSRHADGEQGPGADAISDQACGELADAIGNTVGRDQSAGLGVRERETTADEGEKGR